ncbi:MAG: outer membrane lipid asymmetry maintenance protein MlaD [Lentisphaerae bacterium]|jgi:phospholipid/cholesterol/gamma-HCH transport system substrate-binding protein|nr:outer membrane lipid asymmetry maintenance protein MlaD [Lentisphaerota bacterium]
MKGRLNLELVVGVFMLAGILCLGYLSIKLGKIEVWGKPGYNVFAVFSDTGGLRGGSPVLIAGVEVGQVDSISLENYEARAVLRIQSGLVLHEDAVVSVKTRGLIGEKFLQISAGAADAIILPGGQIRQTESAVDIEALISKFAFGDL